MVQAGKRGSGLSSNIFPRVPDFGVGTSCMGALRFRVSHFAFLSLSFLSRERTSSLCTCVCVGEALAFNTITTCAFPARSKVPAQLEINPVTPGAWNGSSPHQNLEPCIGRFSKH